MWDMYRRGGIIAGTSAGAAIMSENHVHGRRQRTTDATTGAQHDHGNTAGD